MAHQPDPTHRGTRVLATLLTLVILLGGALISPQPAGASLLHLEGPIPADLGVTDHGLASCPSPAHCAQASWDVADPQEALTNLLPVVLALDGVELVETDGPYLHATVSSRLFGFVDDLELFANGAEGQLQARSQSRLGDSDLGVNARRLEHLHRALISEGSTSTAPQL
ncbi:MAG: DUF1499 domain-containing protein [Cyanobacteriota bacterium]|nr:DUF1499 domain-containing protein [Cyanobacteriota bacterium]